MAGDRTREVAEVEVRFRTLIVRNPG